MLSRRELLDRALRLAPAAGAAALAPPTATTALAGSGPSGVLARWFTRDLAADAPRARFWATVASPGVDCLACHPSATPEFRARAHTHQPNVVSCLLCAQGCAIEPGKRGRCRARQNVNGELRSLVYGRPVAVHVDPIEKKPFYHFLPGSAAFSLGTTGCPLRCQFCQNWEISQASPDDYDVPVTGPAQIVEAAAARRAPVIAFTYNEPTVFAEYLLDIAAEARKRRTRTVMVSCGFMNEAPLSEMCRSLDAIKVDLKGFSDDFYRRVSGSALTPVLRSIRQVARSGVHLEIVNLVVPTLNDDDRSLAALATWLVGEVGPDVPVHFTRFHPDFQLRNLPPTPVDTLERARAIAHDTGLRYAYVGNVPGHRWNHTYCPACGKVVVERSSFFVTAMHLRDGRCEYCRAPVKGVWS
jgi:pyruvate formate lyase activating enzyme